MSGGEIVNVWVLLGAAMLGLGALAVSLPEPADPYCEMVTIYQQSGGQYGWPDYRGNYNEVCRHEK